MQNDAGVRCGIPARTRAGRAQLLLAVSLVSVVFLTGVTVSTDPAMFRRGGMGLNEKLRVDRQASAAIPSGRFYANGNCAPDAAATHECRLTSTLQFSTIADESLRNLRRSWFLWVEDGMDVRLNFEFVMKNVSLIDEESGNVIAANANFGTCVPMVASPPHQLLDPETRQPPSPAWSGCCCRTARAP